MKRLFIFIIFLVSFLIAETSQAQTTNSRTHDGDGNKITSTVCGAKRCLDVGDADVHSDLVILNAKDFATQTTLALIKAKTDNIDVLLSTRTKPADTQAVSAVDGQPVNIGTTTQTKATDGTTTSWSVIQLLKGIFDKLLATITVSGNVSGPADSTATDTLDSLNDTVSTALSGFYGVSVSITGTWVGTITFKVSYDGGTNYQTELVFNAIGQLIGSTTGNGQWAFAVLAGVSHVQVLMSSYTSGSATIVFRKTAAIGMPLPTSGLNSGGVINSSQQVGGQWADVAGFLTPIVLRTSPPSSSDTGLVIRQIPEFSSRSDTYTAAANGTTVNVSTHTRQYFGIQVVGTGAAATAWDVVLEGSLNNSNFSTILNHVTATGNGAVLWLATRAPCLYFRSRCVSITLGGATDIVTTIIGRY